MADSTTLRSSSIQKFSQKYLSETITSTLYEQCPLIGFLLGMQGRRAPKDINKIGVGDAGSLMHGAVISNVRREEILRSTTYTPNIAIAKPAQADGKVMGMADTNPVRSDWTNKGPDTYFKRPEFRYCERRDPMKVDGRAIDAIQGNYDLSSEQGKKAVFSLWAAEVQSVQAQHMRWWNQKLWGVNETGAASTGSGNDVPTNFDADVWDTIYSIPVALDTTTSYGGIDRTLSANSHWRGNTITDQTAPSFVSIADDANLTQGCQRTGSPIELMVTGPTIMKSFLAEARAIGGVRVYSGSDELPEMGKVGFKYPVIQYMGCYIICDFTAPSETVLCLNPRSWTVAVKPNKNLKITEPWYEGHPEGGDEAYTSRIITELLIACEAPDINAIYTHVHA